MMIGNLHASNPAPGKRAPSRLGRIVLRYFKLLLVVYILAIPVAVLGLWPSNITSSLVRFLGVLGFAVIGGGALWLVSKASERRAARKKAAEAGAGMATGNAPVAAVSKPKSRLWRVIGIVLLAALVVCSGLSVYGSVQAGRVESQIRTLLANADGASTAGVACKPYVICWVDKEGAAPKLTYLPLAAARGDVGVICVVGPVYTAREASYSSRSGRGGSAVGVQDGRDARLYDGQTGAHITTLSVKGVSLPSSYEAGLFSSPPHTRVTESRVVEALSGYFKKLEADAE